MVTKRKGVSRSNIYEYTKHEPCVIPVEPTAEASCHSSGHQLAHDTNALRSTSITHIREVVCCCCSIMMYYSMYDMKSPDLRRAGCISRLHHAIYILLCMLNAQMLSASAEPQLLDTKSFRILHSDCSPSAEREQALAPHSARTPTACRLTSTYEVIIPV